MTENELLTQPAAFEALAQLVLDEAKRLGASSAELNLAASKGFTVSAHAGEVETVEYHQDKGIEIRVLFGMRSGGASLSDMRPDAVREAVKAACHIATFTDEDDAAGLAEPSEISRDYPQLTLAYDWPITVEQAIAMACEGEREALAYDKRIMSVEASAVGTMQAFHLYANSQGFIGYYPYSKHEMSCVAVAKQGDEMQRDYAYTVAVDPLEMRPVADIAKESAERSVKRLKARSIKTVKTPVIYIAEQARGLLGHFISAISGGNLYRKSSFLLNHLDEQIFPNFVHLQEKPWMPRGLGSVPFDGDGVLTRENIFVDRGRLRQYCLSVYSARKLGMRTTGNAGGVHNLVIEPGNKDLPALLKMMDKGLLITEMMGNGVNLLTGDYSRGVSGFWIEQGEIQFPVQEVTVAGRLQEMYKGIKAVGNDVDVRGNIRTGSILIEEMTVAGH